MMNERIKGLLNVCGMPNEDLMDIYSDPHKTFYMQKFAELIVRECGYHADVFNALGCPVDMDPTEAKPSDYIKREMGFNE